MNEYASEGLTLPGATELSCLPEIFRVEIASVALRRIGRLLGPIVSLYLAKKKRASQAKSWSSCTTVREAMQTSEILSLLPGSVQDQLELKGSFASSNEGEIVIHEGERGGSGVWLLLSGTVRILSTMGRKRKGIRHANREECHQAPSSIEVCTQITGQCRSHSVIAKTYCGWFVITKDVLLKSITSLPSRIEERLGTLVYQQRIRNIPPMDFNGMRNNILFQHFTDSELVPIIQKLRPKFFPSNEIIHLNKPSGQEMFFLIEGTADVLVDNQCLCQLQPGDSFGEMSLIFQERRTDTVRCSGDCDVWMLHFSDFEVCALVYFTLKQTPFLMNYDSDQHQTKDWF
eukprot:TRINITY_DN9093_c0_g1_i1.p2 TRINITY_DN9093_c0_g1~~TRINITY_DN9093_c0_g1_i1.p2  ORF type:complete len:345 (+),score=51.95 TRINITY_DN9093_c0_g1_i1:33-1067(+)